MKKSIFTICFAVLIAGIRGIAAEFALEDMSPNFMNAVQIVWRAPTNDLPKRFWIYKRLPQIFPLSVISNAMALTPIKSKEPLSASTNGFSLWDRTREGHDPMAGYFAVTPELSTISYKARNRYLGSQEGIPADEEIAKRAWEIAFEFGLDRALLKAKGISTNWCDYDMSGRITTNNACGRAIFLCRQIDGIDFYGDEQGLSVEFGRHGQLRNFSLSWAHLEPLQIQETASPEQIVACIKARKTPMQPPTRDEGVDYFAQIKRLSTAKVLTITKITPHFMDGCFGEVPKGNKPQKLVCPFAELEAVADFGETNVTIRLLAPILSSDVKRLLK